MPIDVSVPDSPGWWFARLSRQMNARGVAGKRARRDRLDFLWNYLTGDAPLLQMDQQRAELTREYLRLRRTQYALVITEALLHRTRFLGVRTSQDQDANGDDVVRNIAAASGFGAVSADSMLYEYSLGEGYLMINPPDPERGYDLPVFTAEDPRGVITAQDPLRPLVTRAALKVYADDDRGLDIAHVFTPGRVDVATRKKSTVWDASLKEKSWAWDDEASGPYPEGLGLQSTVPVVKLTNRLGFGEFEPHIDVIDRIHETIGKRLWITAIQAHKARAVIGDLDETDSDGNPIDYNEVLAASPDALWKLPEGVSLWESGALDLTPVLSATKDDVRELSAVSSTPLYMFSPDAAGGSAEGASMHKESITFKADDRVSRNTPPMLEAWRIALLMAGETERANGFLQAMWAPTERFSLQQRGSAAMQAKTSGVPWRSIMSDAWQFDPDTVARMEAERDSDMMLQLTQQAVAAGTPAAAPASPAPDPPPAPEGADGA